MYRNELVCESMYVSQLIHVTSMANVSDTCKCVMYVNKLVYDYIVYVNELIYKCAIYINGM